MIHALLLLVPAKQRIYFLNAAGLECIMTVVRSERAPIPLYGFLKSDAAASQPPEV